MDEFKVSIASALQVLRERKEKAEREAQEIKANQAARKVHFATLFDDYRGITELEIASISIKVLKTT